MPGPAGGHLVMATAGGAASLVVRGRLRVLVALLALMLVAAAVTLRARDGLTEGAVVATSRSGAAVLIEGELVTDPVTTRFTTRADVRVLRFRTREASDWVSGAGRHVVVSGGRGPASALAVLEAGDRVLLDGVLDAVDGVTRPRPDRHAVAGLRLLAVLDFGSPPSPLLRAANSVRNLVLRGSDALPVVEGGLVRGLLVGDTRALPEHVHDEFLASGLTHLLAVSGSNVALVLAVVSPVSRRLGLRGRWLAGLATVVVFAAMTRFEPSVLRASTTAGLAMTAASLGRPTAGLRILFLAVAGLLLVDPLLGRSVAFHLSCGASLGILLLARPIAVRLPGPAWLRDVASTTAAAQVGVAPVLVPVFGSIPVATFPANLVAVPLAGPLTVCGLTTGVVAGLVEPWAPALATAVQLPTALLAAALRSVAAAGSHVPGQIDGRAGWGLLAAGAAVAAALKWCGGRRPQVVS